MPKYVYKASRIQWLGDIPRNWKVKRLAKVGRFSKGGGISRSELEEEGLQAILYGDIYTKYDTKVSDTRHFVSAETAENSRQLKIGDLLFAGSGETFDEIGKCIAFLGSKPTFVGGDVLVFTPENCDSLFLSYLLNSETAVYQKARTGKGDIVVHTYASKLKNMYFPIPPVEEQRAIAEYLDKACDRLDRIISIKQEQLARIDNFLMLRTFEATTKGLRKGVKLKPTKSEWVGGVPENWDIKKIKRLAKVFRGKFTHRPRNDPRFYDGQYPFIQTGSVSKANKYINSYDQTLNDLGLSVSEMFPSGTLTMTIAANIADVAILNFDACFPDSIVGFKPNHRLGLEYLYYLFVGLRQDFLGTAIVTTQMNLNITRIGYVEGFIPPAPEQRSIVEYLNILEKKISNAKKKIESQIEVLKAYRKSLIHECVTGKKQVCAE